MDQKLENVNEKSCDIAKREHGQERKEESHETDQNTLVKIELDTINRKPYFGQISDDKLIYIWVTVFRRAKDELFVVTSTKTLTRNVRATFKLKKATQLQDIHDGECFSYEKFLDDGASKEITGRIIGYNSVKPAELGETTKITVKTNFGVEASGVLHWLSLYGTVAPLCNFITNPSTGLKTDVFQANIILNKHVEEYLPMYGQKAVVHWYLESSHGSL